jgi:hypothetical protein
MKSLRHLVLISLGALFAGTVHAADPDLGDGFLCCNMRTDGAWISDSNYLESGKTIIPFGTPAKFAGFGRNRFHLDIDGKRQSIGNDYSRDLSMETFARRYLVKDDPRLKIRTASPKIRAAAESARVTRGMSREQVLIALGYPISSENPHLDAPQWKYWLWSYSPFVVHFDGAGKVSKVETDPETMSKVYLQ